MNVSIYAIVNLGESPKAIPFGHWSNGVLNVNIDFKIRQLLFANFKSAAATYH